MKCPRCSLVNPKTAQRCDWGYDFNRRSVETPYSRTPAPKKWEEVVEAIATVGGLILVGGFLAFVAGYFSAVLWIRKYYYGEDPGANLVFGFAVASIAAVFGCFVGLGLGIIAFSGRRLRRALIAGRQPE